ncbi:hypothetical protein [Tsuneonella amylolytica]|uniref:hypothetical protein n=1 Tax=Tsuneonella amylolytica TaxID=2338327 RepID=UPI000EA9BD47|nr:hypothetical protein [Tsuneonella amylolytica]
MPLQNPADGPAVPSERLRLPRTGEEAIEPAADFTRARQAEFLRLLAECGVVRVASARAGISYRTVYRERRASAAFARAWDAALVAARAVSEDVLASRALDGVEEAVWFRGEEVGRRVRYDARLLLAHLARLDKLTENTRAAAFAEDFEGALERWEAGADDPAPVCEDCGAALPLVDVPPDDPAPALPGDPCASGEGHDGEKEGAGEGGRTFVPGLCDRCDSPLAEGTATEPSGGWNGLSHTPNGAAVPPKGLTYFDRINLMEDARPAGTPPIKGYRGCLPCEVEDWQVAAFEAGVDRWWCVVPPLEGQDPDEWHYAEAPDAAA